MIALVRGETVNAIWFVFAAVCTYLIGYRFYSKVIEQYITRPDDRRATPAETRENGKDFVPTDRRVLFGHHFAAIAGAGPLVGPVLAAQMGYLPGTIWIIVGVVLAGAMQDYTMLFFSMRRGGRHRRHHRGRRRLRELARPRGRQPHARRAQHPGRPGGRAVDRVPPGGAPTLALGLAHIMHQLVGGTAIMGFWYHFAILFEALFILTAVDGRHRAGRRARHRRQARPRLLGLAVDRGPAAGVHGPHHHLASFEKIFSDVPAAGYWAQHRAFKDALAAQDRNPGSRCC